MTTLLGVLAVLGIARAARTVPTTGGLGSAPRVPLRAIGSSPASPASAVPAIVHRALVDAAVPWPAGRCWKAWRALVVGGLCLGGVAGGPGAALVLAGAGVAGPALALLGLRGRAAATADASLPDMLDAIARALRGGASLVQAIDDAAGTAPPSLAAELSIVAGSAAAGLPLTLALDEWAGRVPRRAVRLTVAALALASEAGGGAARAIDGVASSLRAELGVQSELRALSSQARYSALVIGLAPVGFGALAALVDQRTAGFLLGTGSGLVCLAAGLALDAAGGWWMHRIVATAA